MTCWDRSLGAPRLARARNARCNASFYAAIKLRDRDGGHLDLCHSIGLQYANLLCRRGREAHDAIERIRPAVLDGDYRALPGLQIGSSNAGHVTRARKQR